MQCDRLLDLTAWFQEKATSSVARARRAGFQDLVASASRVAVKFDKITADIYTFRKFDENLFWSALHEYAGVEQELDVRDQ
jgi:hypothetical protein